MNNNTGRDPFMDFVACPFGTLYDEFMHPERVAKQRVNDAKRALEATRHSDNEYLAYGVGRLSTPEETAPLGAELRAAEQELKQFTHTTPELEERLRAHDRNKSIFATATNALACAASAAIGYALLENNDTAGLLFAVPTFYFGMLTPFEPLRAWVDRR